MAILGGTLAALLVIALVFLGVMIYKRYGKRVEYLIRKKVSALFVPEFLRVRKWDLRRL